MCTYVIIGPICTMYSVFKSTPSLRKHATTVTRANVVRHSHFHIKFLGAFTFFALKFQFYIHTYFFRYLCDIFNNFYFSIWLVCLVGIGKVYAVYMCKFSIKYSFVGYFLFWCRVSELPFMRCYRMCAIMSVGWCEISHFKTRSIMQTFVLAFNNSLFREVM